MVDYKKYGSVKVDGKKKIVYHKSGSTKNYVKYKSRYINLSKYKKIKAKKLLKQKGGDGSLTEMMSKITGGSRCRKVKRCTKIKSGKNKGKKSCRKICKK